MRRTGISANEQTFGHNFDASKGIIKDTLPFCVSENDQNSLLPNSRCYSAPWVSEHQSKSIIPSSTQTLHGLGSPRLNASFNLGHVQLSLSFLQLDPADRAVITVADRRDAIQKKAFTNWVNHHLSKRNCWVQDLFTDLRTGYLLVRLLECLTDEILGLEYIDSRLHWIQNVQRVLTFLRYRGIRIINIRADEIVDGNPKLTLGLIWIIILHFQLTTVMQDRPSISIMHSTENTVDEVAKLSLLTWCREATSGYPGVFVRDFTDSWRDGHAFLALIHRYRPELINFRLVDRQNANENLELAFTVAEQQLQVTRLFDAEDLATTVDERSMITYVASLYEALTADTQSVPPMPPLYINSSNYTSSHSSRLTSVAALQSGPSKLWNTRWSEYRSIAAELIQWLQSTTSQMTTRNFPADLESIQDKVLDAIKRHRLEERPRRERERQQLVRLNEELKSTVLYSQPPNDPFLSIDYIDRLWTEYDRAIRERELAARAEVNRLSRLQWIGDRVARDCRSVEVQLTALERHMQPSATCPAGLIRAEGIDRWNEQLCALETKLNGLFNQVQHLRIGRYVRTEQLYRDVCKSYQRFLDLKRRIEGQLTFASRNNTQMTQPVTSHSIPSYQSSIAHGRARVDHESNPEFLSSIQRCLARITELAKDVNDGCYGTSYKGVEEATRKQEHLQREVEHFRTEVDRCQSNLIKSVCEPEEARLFDESIRTLKQEYQLLLEACNRRSTLSHSLLDFVRSAERELCWLRERESVEVNRNWTDSQALRSDTLQSYLQNVVEEMKQREARHNELCVLGSSMQLDGHPADALVQSYLTALERHWSWLFQLIECSGFRANQLIKREVLLRDIAECESFLLSQLKTLCSELDSTHHTISLKTAEQMKSRLKCILDEVNERELHVIKLRDETSELVPLSVGAEPDCLGLTVRTLCCFRSADYWSSQPTDMVLASAVGEVFWPTGDESGGFDKGDSLVLLSQLNSNVWSLRTPSAICMNIPSICFLPTWTCGQVAEHMKRLGSLLSDVKSKLFFINLRLDSQLLEASITNWQSKLRSNGTSVFPADGFDTAQHLTTDGLRHLLTLRLANRPAHEIEQFESQLHSFENSLLNFGRQFQQERSGLSVNDEDEEGDGQILKQLRHNISLLALRLQGFVTQPLPDRASDLTQLIQEHKSWTHEVSRVLTQCMDVKQHASRTVSHGSSISPVVIQAEALNQAAEQLASAGRAHAQFLADVDAWFVRLGQLDQAQTDYEHCLLGSAMRAHCLSPGHGTLEEATPDGIRTKAIEQTHNELKSIAERIPNLRDELDLLSQQLAQFNCISIPVTEVCQALSSGSPLSLLFPVNSELLEAELNTSQRRLYAGMKEVECELKAFGDSLRLFTDYQRLRDQLTGSLTQLQKSATGLSELSRSIGLGSGPDQCLIDAVLTQMKSTMTDTGNHVKQVEKLNRNVAQLVYVLTAYARSTQTYRELVETTFQKSGALRDYRWSPGFGLYDLPQVLRDADQLTENYNREAMHVYDQVKRLCKVIRESGYTGPLPVFTPLKSAHYDELYSGEWPVEFPVRIRRSGMETSLPPLRTPITTVAREVPLQYSAFNPVTISSPSNSIPVSQEPPCWEVYLTGVDSETIILLPFGWNTRANPTGSNQTFDSLLRNPLPTSGAWFVTRLTSLDETAESVEKPMCLGDALRCGLLDPRNKTCRQVTLGKPGVYLRWDEAVKCGALTEQAVRVMREPVEIKHGVQRPLADCLFRSGEFLDTPGFIDPSTGQVLFESNNEVSLTDLFAQGKLTETDFYRLVTVLTSGIRAEFHDTVIQWCDAKTSAAAKLCLSDWLTAGAFNPKSRRLRVSIFRSDLVSSTASVPQSSFCEVELTIQEAISCGLVDANIPEIVVPMENSSSKVAGVPYRRVPLATSISLGLVDPVKGLWCGLPQWGTVLVGLDIAHAAGLISRAPSLSEALLSGYLFSHSMDADSGVPGGMLDAHTGRYLSLREAVQRGLLFADRPSLVVDGRTLTLREALRTGILNDAGQFPSPTGACLSLWNSVNCGMVKLVHIDVNPPPVGILQTQSASEFRYHQHPVIQAIRTNLLDSTTEHILLSEAEARQYGLGANQRRVPLRKSPKVSGLCDSYTVRLLTEPCGITYSDGEELTGLEALARGWLKPRATSKLHSLSFGQLLDPTTDQTTEVCSGANLSTKGPFFIKGIELLLSLSAHRPELGYLVTRRLISKLSWSGPGLHTDVPSTPSRYTSTIHSTVEPTQFALAHNVPAIADQARKHCLTSSVHTACRYDLPNGFTNPVTEVNVSTTPSIKLNVPVQNGSHTRSEVKRDYSPSPTPPRKKIALTPLVSLRKLFRSQSPGGLSNTSDVSDGSEMTTTHSRHDESKSLRSKGPVGSRFLAKFSALKGAITEPPTEQDAAIKKIRSRPLFSTQLKERNCVLYAFYYIHDEVRVEAAITDSMVREGRVDTKAGTVCNPISGRPTRVSDALTKGFVFGIVFTRAERYQSSTLRDTTGAAKLHTPTTSEPLFWLEVFHHRHDIYQLERVYDPYDRVLISIEDAFAKGILDPIHCTYTHPVSGELYSIEDALYSGWIQAVPVGVPPPFELQGCSFDNVHVRTIEEGFTFSTITRPVAVSLAAEKALVGSKSAISSFKNGVRTTLNLKRHMPGQPTPQVHHFERSSGTAPLLYHMKEGYQLTPTGRVQDSVTGKQFSILDAVRLQYATPIASNQQQNGLSQEVPSKTDLTELGSQLLVSLRAESSWLECFELFLLEQPPLALDISRGALLIGKHQECLENISRRQNTVRSVLFQAEQYLKTNRDLLAASTFERLQTETASLRDRLDCVLQVSEACVHTLVANSDILENLLTKLEEVRGLLDDTENAINASSNRVALTNLDELEATIDRSRGTMSSTVDTLTKLNALSEMARSFLSCTARYTKCKNAFRKSLSHRCDLRDRPEYSDDDLERDVAKLTQEVNSRFMTLNDKARLRLAQLLSAQYGYSRLCEELVRHETTLGYIAQRFSELNTSLDPVLLHSDRLNESQLNEMKTSLEAIGEMSSQLGTLQHNIEKILQDVCPRSRSQLLECGFTDSAVYGLVTNRVEEALRQCISLLNAVDKKSSSLARRISQSQPITSVLDSAADSLSMVDRLLAVPQPNVPGTESEELRQADSKLKMHEAALKAARDMLDSGMKDLEYTSETDLDPMKCISQIASLERRLDSTRKAVGDRLRHTVASQDLLGECHRIGAEVTKWIEDTMSLLRSPPFPPFHEDQLYKRIRNIEDELKENENKVREMRQLTSVHTTLADAALCDEWTELVAGLETRLLPLKQEFELSKQNLNLRKTRCTPYVSARQSTDDWLITTEGILHTLPPTALSSETLRRQLSDLDQLITEWTAYGDQMAEISRLGMAYLATVHSFDPSFVIEEPNVVTRELQDLDSRYVQLGTKLHERHAELKATLANVDNLERKHSDLLTWLNRRVQMLLNQCEKLTGLEAIREAIREAESIHKEITGGLASLDEFRQLALALLQDKGCASGATELRNIVTNTERHWSTALKVATERRDRLQQLLQDAIQFTQSGAALEARVSQITETVRSVPYVDQVTSGPVTSHLNQLRSAQSDMDSVLEEYNRLLGLGKHLTERLLPVCAAELRIGQTIQEIGDSISHLRDEVSTRSTGYERDTDPSEKVNKLAATVNDLLDAMQNRLDESNVAESDVPHLRSQLNKAETLLSEAHALCDHMDTNSLDPDLLFKMGSELLRQDSQIADLDCRINQLGKPSTAPELIVTTNQMNELCQWMSTKSDQLSGSNIPSSLSASGLREDDSGERNKRLQMLQALEQEIGQKKDALHQAKVQVSAAPYGSLKKPLEIAEKQLELLEKVVTAEQCKLGSADTEPQSLTGRLNQLEEWTSTQSTGLLKPLFPPGEFLAQPQHLEALEKQLSCIAGEIDSKHVELQAMLAQLRPKELPVSVTVESRIVRLGENLTRLNADARSRLCEIVEIKNSYNAADDAMKRYRAAVDETETSWLGLQQDLPSGKETAVLAVIELGNLQSSLFALLDESGTPTSSSAELSPAVNLVQSFRRLDSALKNAGDTLPSHSMAELLNEAKTTRKRIETIVQSITNETGRDDIGSDITLALVKRLNAVSKEVRTAKEFLSSFPVATPGVDPRTLRERTQSLNELSSNLSSCRNTISELRNQLQPELLTRERSPGITSLLDRLDRLEKEADDAHSQVGRLEDEVQHRLPETEQLVELRNRLAESVQQAREVCLTTPGGSNTDALKLIQAMDEHLERLRTLSRHLSGSDSDSVTQHQLDAEIVAAENAVAMLGTQLSARTSISDAAASQAEYATREIERLRVLLDNFLDDFATQFVQSQDMERTTALDNYRLLRSRVAAHSSSLDHLNATLNQTSDPTAATSPESKQHLVEAIGQLQKGYADLTNRLDSHLNHLALADCTQTRYLDQLQDVLKWLNGARQRFDQPPTLTTDEKSGTDSMLFTNSRAELRKMRELMKEVDSQRKLFNGLKREGESLIASKQVLDPELVFKRLTDVSDAFVELRTDAQQRLCALEAALPIAQRLSSTIAILAVRLPDAENRLRCVRDGQDPINVKRMMIDQLEAESISVLAPKAQLLQNTLDRLLELALPSNIFRPMMPQPDGTEDIDSLTEIKAELSRFDQFAAELAEVASELHSTRHQTAVIQKQLDNEALWLNLALRRLDPAAALDASRFSGDPKTEEYRFTSVSDASIELPTEESSLHTQFPPLAVLSTQPGFLSQLRDRLTYFHQGWSERQTERTTSILAEAHRLLQSAGIHFRGRAVPVKSVAAPTVDKLHGQIVLAADLVAKRVAQLENRVVQARARVEEVAQLAEPFRQDMMELTSWIKTTSLQVDRISNAVAKGQSLSESEIQVAGSGERQLHQELRALEQAVEHKKSTLDRLLRTSGLLIDLVSSNEAISIRNEVQHVSNCYDQLVSNVKTHLNNVETILRQSDETTEQFNMMADLFAKIAEQASHLGIQVAPSSNWTRTSQIPAGLVEVTDGDSVTVQPDLEPDTGRLHSILSVQPDQLKEHVTETTKLLDTLSSRLPELEALTAFIRANLEPKLRSRSVQNVATVEPVLDPFTADSDRAMELHKSILKNTEKLQTDWIRLQAQLQSRANELNSLYNISANEFWPLLSSVQATLTQCVENLKLISAGRDLTQPAVRRDPLNPESYIMQKTDLNSMVTGIVEPLASKLTECHTLGDRLIQLATKDSDTEKGFNFRPEEEQVLRNEVNYALQDLDSFYSDVSLNCQRLAKRIDAWELDSKQFSSGLSAFLDWLSRQEVKLDQLDPVSSHSSHIVLKQLEEVISWNNDLLQKHSDLESLNWAAGRLISADIDELDLSPDFAELAGGATTAPSALQADLASANRRWDVLMDAGNNRRHRLQTVLLGLGEFDHALNALLSWITQTQANIDQLPVRRGNTRGLEADLARAKVLQNNINNHQLAVVRLKEQSKKYVKADELDASGLRSSAEAVVDLETKSTSERLALLNTMWERLRTTAREKQHKLEEALRETFNFHSQFDRLVRRCRQLESHMPTPGSRIMGCLPDSAREQLRRFVELYDGLVRINDEFIDLRKTSAALLISEKVDGEQQQQQPERLITMLDRFDNHLANLLTRAGAIREQLQVGLGEVEHFHEELAQMIQWLTTSERVLAQQKPVSRIVARLGQLILDHTNLRKDIDSHRDALLSLDRNGAKVQCGAQKLDVVLVRNLLASVHNRWEQLLSRSAERTRQLNIGLKEAQTFLNSWTTLTDWLKESLTWLEEESVNVATRPERLSQQLAKHQEFQRALGARNLTFDAIRRYTRHLRDRAPACDHDELDDMINELKHLWHAVCARSLDRQRALEQALLSAGLYREALQSMSEWLAKLEPQLIEHQVGIYGDVDTVEQLLEAHQHLVGELNQRTSWIDSIRESAAELMSKASQSTSGTNDVTAIRNQLDHLNTVWNRVQALTNQRTDRLNEALSLAVQFQKMCRSLMDYFAGAEHLIRRLAALPTYDDEVGGDLNGADDALGPMVSADKSQKGRSVNGAPEDLTSAIEAHKQTHANLMDQAERVENTLQLGTQLLAQSHPEAVPRLRQWIHTIQNRWNDLLAWSAQRGDRLRTALSEQDQRRELYSDLVEWINSTRKKVDSEPAITLAEPIITAVDKSSASASISDAVVNPTAEEAHVPRTETSKLSSRSTPFEEQPMVTSFRTLPLHEITEPELVERLLEEQAELEHEFATRQPILDAILKHAKLRVIPKYSIPKGQQTARRSRGGTRGMSRGRSSVNRPSQPVPVPGSANGDLLFVSPSMNQLHQKWTQLQRILDARRAKLRDRLSYLSEVERLKTFDFEAWRQRYVTWLNQHKARVIDLFHRKDLDRDGRLTYAEFIDGIMEMKFTTNRVELQAVAEIFDINGDGYIDYRECLNALRTGYISSRTNLCYSNVIGDNSSSMLSLSQVRSTDEEAINDEVRRQVGLCTCHNTYQICKMTTNKYRFGDSQKLRLVRILKSAVMVRVGGGWVNLDEFLSKNDPCRATNFLDQSTSSDKLGTRRLRSSLQSSLATASRSGSSVSVPLSAHGVTTECGDRSKLSTSHLTGENKQSFDNFVSKSLSLVEQFDSKAAEPDGQSSRSSSRLSICSSVPDPRVGTRRFSLSGRALSRSDGTRTWNRGIQDASSTHPIATRTDEQRDTSKSHIPSLKR